MSALSSERGAPNRHQGAELLCFTAQPWIAMPPTEALSIALPEEMARAVHARVESGAYANESEVISEGLRALGAQEQAVERWLATEGVARFDAYSAAPDQTLAADEAGNRLREHIGRRGTRNGA